MTAMNAYTQENNNQSTIVELENARLKIKTLEVENAYLNRKVGQKDQQLDLFKNNV